MKNGKNRQKGTPSSFVRLRQTAWRTYYRLRGFFYLWSLHALLLIERLVPPLRILSDRVRSKTAMRQLKKWQATGCPVPPPHVVKAQLLRDIAKKQNIRTLVETGTCYGDMIAALKDDFDKIYTIELSVMLHAMANRRFKNDHHIRCLQGDSSLVLKDLMPRLETAALFWLDGHASGGITAAGDEITPIFAELDHIFTSSKHQHVIAIDDARLFENDTAYPRLESLQARVEQAGMCSSIESDIIIISSKKDRAS